MKKVLLTSAVALFIIACANTKDLEETATETKSVSVPTVVDSEPMVAPNAAGSETVEGVAKRKAVLPTATIEWLDFETAIERNEDNPKYILIDVYTEWCGWCKRMDASTFVDPQVVKFINEKCYAVKMDAEMKEAIAYNGKLYEYQKVNEKTGYNALAISLLDSQMSFPSFVVLDKKEAKRGKIMGYKTPQPFLAALGNYVK